MKNLLITALMSLLLMTSFKIEEKNNTKKEVLLVLSSPFGKESFSIFKIKEVNNVLIGENFDSDYPVADGVYHIEGCSNNKFYHKKILIQN